MTAFFAEVLLPLASSPYTFAVDRTLGPVLKVGSIVAVPLGARKIYTGVVWRLGVPPPEKGTVKSIIKVLYPDCAVPRSQTELWRWMSEYYMCSAGEVMRAALPSRLKAEGFSIGEFDDDIFAPRTERYVALNPELGTLGRLHEILDGMKRAHGCRRAAEHILSLLGDEPFSGRVPRRDVDVSAPVLRKLEDRGIVTLFEDRAVPDAVPAVSFDTPVLSDAQSAALAGIGSALTDKDTVLLHGVMSSGKSEVFLSKAAQVLQEGGDVLILLPEISVTAQFARRVRKIFGDRVTIYHSRLTDRARAQTYMNMLHAATPQIVVGVRSALFLPFRSLRLVVVDEEHDSSYKQTEPAPRYNARDAALMLARIAGAKTVLSSATPSLESYANALSGRYALVSLGQRYGNSPSPEIELSDTSAAVRRSERKLHFNRRLLDAVRSAVEGHRQVLLFQNRRGVAPYVECAECGWSARCPSCGVSMTLHGDGLRCHYCGRRMARPAACPSCGARSIETCGFGTEKIEEVLAELVPFARTARLDHDTATSATAYMRTVEDFENGRTDILVGTQIVTKGFDFDRLAVVGVLNADNLLNFPDFRASERAFATLMQISGRAGRREERGLVIIQTSQPQNPVLQQVMAGDYDAFAQDALRERAAFGYPPYSRMIRVIMRHADLPVLDRAAQDMALRLRAVFGDSVLGPQAPAVEFHAGRHNSVIMIKVARSTSHALSRARIAEAAVAVRSNRDYKGITVIADVDPV